MLDLRTVALLTIVAAFIFAFAAIFLSRLLPEERNLRVWVAASVTDIIGLSLLALRDVIPDTASIALGNSCVIAGLGLCALASRGLVGLCTSRVWFWLLGAYSAFAFAVFTFLLPSLPDRVVANALFNIPSMTVAAWALWRHSSGASRVATRLSAVIFGGGAIMNVARAVGVSGLTATPDFNATPSTLMVAPYVFGMVLSLWLSVMLTLTVSDRIQQRLRVERDRAEAANRELLVLSTTDALTGLANRAKVDAHLTSAVIAATDTGAPFAIVLLDLDSFKEVNDTFGHPVGDTVLVSVASTLASHLRTPNTIGRWGGEEFLAVLPTTTTLGAQRIAEELRQAVAALDHPICGPVTASFGVTGYRDGDDAPQLVSRADRAMYGAKQLGRNRVVTL